MLRTKVSVSRLDFILNILAFFSIVLFQSCLKYDKLSSPAEHTIYMPQAYADDGVLQIYKIDSTQTTYFGAALGGLNYATKDITVTFEIDTSVIQQYNEDNDFQNYNYVALPKTAYAVSALTSIIKKGNSSSEPLTLSINAENLNDTTEYILPIRIVKTTEGTIDSTLGITYFKINSLIIRSRDITSQATLSVSADNTAGPTGKQGSTWVVDSNFEATDKFFTPNYSPGFWMQLQFNTAQSVNAYTMTSANDNPQRDPFTWVFQGSDDGATWVTLDSRQNYTFASRNQTVTFELNQSDDKAHIYYRLLITANNGGANEFQLNEWRLLQYY